MQSTAKKIVIHTPSQISENVGEWANQFYRAKKVEGVSSRTLAIYKQQLSHFLDFCNGQLIEDVTQVTANNIRDYLIWLEETGHNPGGLHVAYRTLKTFLRWFDDEMEPEGWRNPIHKIKAPKLQEEPLKPVDSGDVLKMVATCDSSFLGRRNRALLLFLLDTGARAREALAVDTDDIDPITGDVLIRQGKGRKPRAVFIGKDTRKAVRAYLKGRADNLGALWVTDDQKVRLKYPGLRVVLIKHARLAQVDPPSPHDFRRAFAINMLRNGCDLITLARLMGHTSLKVLQRYLYQVKDDLQKAHSKGSPVDHMEL